MGFTKKSHYLADNGPVLTALLRDNGDTVNIAVLSDGKDGSGLSSGLEVKFDVPKNAGVGSFITG